MVSASQAAHVVALVRERHNGVKQAFDVLLNAFAIGDRNQTAKANEKFIQSLGALKAVVAAEHWPDWLKAFHAAAERCAGKHSNDMQTWRAHLNIAIAYASSLTNETWKFSEKDDILFDVDSIVLQARLDFKIDELYEQVIECLRDLLDSGDVDSVKACSDLNMLISNLRSAKQGSFTSQVFNWQFARRLIPNIISSYVKRSDITGPLIEAFEKTAEELDISMEKAKDQIGQNIINAASSIMQTDTANEIDSSMMLFLKGPEN